MFLRNDNRNDVYPCKPQFYCLKVGFKGVKIILACFRDDVETVVVVRIFYATRHPRHIEAAAIVMFMYLYSLAFMNHPCTVGAHICHQAPPCLLYTQPTSR